MRASFSAFQVFFLAVHSTIMPWRAQFHHKCQRWRSWHTCMPQNGTFIECWSYALLSVGLVRLFLSLSSFFCTDNSIRMPWRAQSRLKSQRWPSWTTCMPQVWLKLLSVGHVFYWVLVVCASFSAFQVFFFLTGTSITTPCRAQSHHKSQRWPIFRSCMSQIWTKVLSVVTDFIECWSCAPLSHIFKVNLLLI